MTNYNHIRSASQQRSADDYRQYLDALNTSYEQSGLTVGIDELKKLNALTEELEKLPQLDGEMSSAMLAYPNMMTDIFKTQQQFDQALAGHLATVDQGGDVIRTIDDLRVDISSIMLLYSVSTFTGLAYLNEEDPELTILHGRIQEHFQALDQQLPEALQGHVGKVKGPYHFVQKKLVGLPRPWTPSAVVFFLTRAEAQLQELARQVESTR
ncbi:MULTISPECIES: hypothetical protein [Pseudomonas]|uniref:hypothetical protein n=1 Tax=Pseudomonas TaxID=286 RepID=UPI00106A624D|nr:MULTISPECIES: hypothetical protein [Pseudomonas]MDH0639342.1 hypothetical protein [Pseudomonas sp. GD03860]